MWGRHFNSLPEPAEDTCWKQQIYIYFLLFIKSCVKCVHRLVSSRYWMVVLQSSVQFPPGTLVLPVRRCQSGLVSSGSRDWSQRADPHFCTVPEETSSRNRKPVCSISLWFLRLHLFTFNYQTVLKGTHRQQITQRDWNQQRLVSPHCDVPESRTGFYLKSFVPQIKHTLLLWRHVSSSWEMWRGAPETGNHRHFLIWLWTVMDAQ